MGHRVGVVLTPVPRQFYDRAVLDVARDLLGVVLESSQGGELVRIRLTEVEAYGGMADPASHAFRGPSPRNRTMFGPPGHAYVYFTYGMHFCMNLVTGAPGTAAAVLLRAGTVVDGVQVVARRRPGIRPRDFARGPARLTRALGVDLTADGADVCAAGGSLRVLPSVPVAEGDVRSGPRVGVTVATDVPWRFWVADDDSVSPYRAGGSRRRRGSTRV